MKINRTVKLLSLAMITTFAFSACGGSGGGSDDLGDIVGIWDDSVNGDVAFTAIDPQGNIRFYDYQADAFGSGDNCYVNTLIDEGASSFKVQRNGNFYDAVAVIDGENFVIENLLSVSDDGNFLTAYDISDSALSVSSNGDVVARADISTPDGGQSMKLEGLHESDFNLCDNSAGFQNDDPGFSRNSNSFWVDSLLSILLR